MNQSDLPSSLPAAGALPQRPRVALIQASWHAEIVGQAREGFLAELAHLGCATDGVQVFTVPGAFEIPLHAKKLAASGRFDAIVATGLVAEHLMRESEGLTVEKDWVVCGEKALEWLQIRPEELADWQIELKDLYDAA